MAGNPISEEARLDRDARRLSVALYGGRTIDPDQPDRQTARRGDVALLLAGLDEAGLTLAPDRGRRTARRGLAIRYDR